MEGRFSLHEPTFWGLYSSKQGSPGRIHLVGVRKAVGFGFGFTFRVVFYCSFLLIAVAFAIAVDTSTCSLVGYITKHSMVVKHFFRGPAPQGVLLAPGSG